MIHGSTMRGPDWWAQTHMGGRWLPWEAGVEMVELLLSIHHHVYSTSVVAQVCIVCTWDYTAH